MRSAFLTLVLMPSLAGAADGTWSAMVGATTDYIYRGVSQTYDSGALQLGASYQGSGGWFAGTWASNVDQYPFGANEVELDLYTGIRRPLGPDFSGAVVYTRYQYVDDPRPVHYAYDEVAVSASYLDVATVTLSYQPDRTLYSDLGFARRRPSFACELAGRWPLRAGFALQASAGYYDLQHLFGVSYLAGDAGLQYTHGRATVELSRFFADATVGRLFEDATARGTWVLAALYRF
jgi:uncharacterized protein (TIGR02001 family)